MGGSGVGNERAANGLDRGRSDVASVIAVLACSLLVALLIYLAGRPLDTSDTWWHLKMGEVYASQGLWPDGDPLLHTAHADAPVQHEWLFGVVLYAIQRASGFYGLRVVHALAVSAILWFGFALFRRREGRGHGALARACLATSLFVTLSWWRLFQLRPDLLSIAAVFLLYHLLLESPEPPSRRRVAAATALMLVWANVHSLFALGFALLVAALLGLLLQSLLESRRRPVSEYASAGNSGRPRARQLALALALGALASLLNPRGVKQHLTFLTSSSETGIWFVRDEWTHFDPFRWGHYAQSSVSFTSWLAMDLLMGLFFLGSAAALVAYLRRPSRAALERFDPVLFGLGLASIAAILVSVRFLWLSFFPLLYLLQLDRSAPVTRAVRARAWVTAAACVALLVAFFGAGGFERDAARPSAYLSRPYSLAEYHVFGVRFLAATGVEGNLFNGYSEGGFLGYWLAPKLRTFIDSRTEHYERKVISDYTLVNRQRGGRPGQSFLDVLDENRVDLFFGSGLPAQRDLFNRAAYTTAHLEGAPGWVPVFRTVEEAIYLRKTERNRANLERIAAYYGREGVPFDLERGLDVEAVIEARPDWAITHHMLPKYYEHLLRESRNADPERRFRALDQLGYAYAALGAYRSQLAVDREAKALRPRAKSPRRRLVYGLLHLGRQVRALAEARALYDLDPKDPRSKIFLRTARSLRPRVKGFSPARNRAVGELPLLASAELGAMFSHRYAAASPSSDREHAP